LVSLSSAEEEQLTRCLPGVLVHAVFIAPPPPPNSANQTKLWGPSGWPVHNT